MAKDAHLAYAMTGSGVASFAIIAMLHLEMLLGVDRALSAH